jgi:hypothetical protein
VTEPEIVRRATAELTALALAVRADWDEHAVSGVIQQAGYDGMTWPQVLVAFPRLMADPQASPRDLVAERHFAQPSSNLALPAEVNAQRAAEVRELMELALRAGGAA